MNKEQILAISRSENADLDERERNVYMRAGFFSRTVGAILCMILFVVEIVLNKSVNLSVWIIYLGMNLTTSLVQYVRLKRKLFLLSGVIRACLLAAFLVLYVVKAVR